MMTIEDKEKRGASIHEVAHSIVCRVYGGVASAKIWRNTDEGVAAGEKAWLGECITYCEPGSLSVDAELSRKLGQMPAPGNAMVLVGMAGLVAELMDGGIVEPHEILMFIQEQIECGDVSPTDLESIGDAYGIAEVYTLVKVLSENWQTIEKEAAWLAENV